MKIKLKNIDLSVSNIAVSLEFYTQVLQMGSTPESAPPHMMILASEGNSTTLSLHQTGTQGGREVSAGSVELAFECDDLEAARGTIRAFGLEPSEIAQFGFGQSFEAKDPDGYALNLYKLHAL